MFVKLSGLQWKGAVRSTMWARNLAANIFIGIALFLLSLNLISIGLFIDVIFEKAAPEIDPVSLINSYLLYYFILDLAVRLVFQKKHGILLKPLLLLPLSRNSLVNYILVKSSYSIFNFIPLLVIIPFTFKVVAVTHGLISALAWIIFFISLVLCNSYIAVYIKRTVAALYRYALYFGITGAAIYFLDVFNVVSFSDISNVIFSLPLENPVYVFLPLIELAAVYSLNFNFMRSRMYAENLAPAESRRTGRWTILQKIEGWGETGKYIALELKLLTRNKRSRSTIYLSLAMIFFGIIVYPGYTRDDRFPEPLAEHEQFIQEFDKETAAMPGARKVTFKVLPESVPRGATLFISGNHAVLRNWKANGMPLSMNPDSSWSRSIYLNEGTALKYKVTLGSWGRQRILKNGEVPEDFDLIVNSDTTVVIKADTWDSPPFRTISSIFLIYMGIIIVGMFLIAYGQFMLGWESSYFDSILSSPVDFSSYFKGKLYIMLVACTFFYVVTLVYTIFGIRVLLTNTAVFLYNIGVNTYVLFFMACLNRKRFDLDLSIMSTQGKGAGQYLTIVPTILIPTIIFVPFALSDNAMIGLAVLAGLGITGLIFQKQIMKLVVAFFYKNKYKLATAFRIH